MSKPDKGIAGLDAIGTAVRPIQDRGAVEIEFVDAPGGHCAVWPECRDLIQLIVRLIEALSIVDGSLSAPQRLREAQLLLQALIEPRDRRARWVAQRLGVGDSAISLWRSGKAVPTEARLDQLRQLVKSTVRAG